MLALFLPLFVALILCSMPVFFAMLLAPGSMIYFNDMERDIPLLFRNIYNGMDSMPLMAIPFFMLAGELMNSGGITHRLIDFSQKLIGHVRGGLAHVNVLASMLFAGLSGFLSDWPHHPTLRHYDYLCLHHGSLRSWHVRSWHCSRYFSWFGTDASHHSDGKAS